MSQGEIDLTAGPPIGQEHDMLRLATAALLLIGTSGTVLAGDSWRWYCGRVAPFGYDASDYPPYGGYGYRRSVPGLHRAYLTAWHRDWHRHPRGYTRLP
jgi:hypothetical protein